MSRQFALLSIACLAAGAIAVSCEDAVVESFTEGPSLKVVVDSLALAPTGDDPARCCCIVVGHAVNQSAVAVHATVKVEVFAAESEPIGTAVDFMEDLQPGEERRIRASGLLVPCTNIERLELVDVDVRGVWFPGTGKGSRTGHVQTAPASGL
jgi:hypothetical protein